MAKKLTQGGSPANPYPKRFHVPADIQALGTQGQLIVNAIKAAYHKRMTVDIWNIRGKKNKKNYS